MHRTEQYAWLIAVSVCQRPTCSSEVVAMTLSKCTVTSTRGNRSSRCQQMHRSRLLKYDVLICCRCIPASRTGSQAGQGFGEIHRHPSGYDLRSSVHALYRSPIQSGSLRERTNERVFPCSHNYNAESGNTRSCIRVKRAWNKSTCWHKFEVYAATCCCFQ